MNPLLSVVRVDTGVRWMLLWLLGLKIPWRRFIKCILRKNISIFQFIWHGRPVRIPSTGLFYNETV